MESAKGKLGVMCVGLGAVTTTFITGVLMARKGLAKPVGSMTQYDKIRVGRGENKKYLHYGEIVPLTDLKDIVFGAWDVYPANAFESAVNAEVLKAKDILPVEDELKAIKPMKAAFDRDYAKRLDGDNVKDCATRWDMVEALREDIRKFKAENGCDRIVVIWAASTEIYVPVDEEVHGTLAALEAAMKADDRKHIAPSSATPTQPSQKAHLSLWAHPTRRWISPPCGKWLKRPRCLSPARTSRRARRS